LGESYTPPTATPPPSANSRLYLQILQGEDYGKEYELSRLLGSGSSGVLKIGRQDPSGEYMNDVAIREENSNYISRMHATIEKNERGWYIKDGQFGEKRFVSDWHPSLNGTYLNGMEVTHNRPTMLKQNDIITLGNTTIKVVVR
jgi:pSer/pThr/pTyr-binding forkhead associated (FHA) protein